MRDSRTLSNIDRVINPINAPKIITLTNDVNHAVVQFAERADLELVGVDEQELLAWSEAAKTSSQMPPSTSVRPALVLRAR